MGRYWESLPIHVGQQVHYKYVGIVDNIIFITSLCGVNH
jgi:hypothetical protein